ncbi:MAG: SiaB family protein kinase [Bacteroidales bacterium]|nr:SiaB family protein kinase [Bacteroidales bacterium]
MADHTELVKKVRHIMMEDSLLFVYRGAVTGQNSVALLSLLEKEMLNSEFGLTGRKRLFMFVLESLQNVSRHINTSEHACMSLVVYSKNDSGYTVSTGNVIHNEEEEGLRKQLVVLNTLAKDELRALYREKLGSTSLSDKGGAGLGLIEMARKTGNKLDFDFLRLDEELLYFVLSKSVDASGQSMNTGQQRSIFKGDNIVRLEKMMAGNNITSVWSGHLTTDIERQVLSFAETRMLEEDLALRAQRKIFNIMVECLQNISKYNPGPEIEKKLGKPVAIIVNEGHRVRITTGNIVKNSRIPVLRDKLKTVNKYDKKGLKELFRISLAGDEIKAEQTGFLGLIDIARRSEHKLDYDFQPVDGDYSYYLLSVQVDISDN